MPGSCLLNSTANPAHFHPSLAGLAVLFSRQLPNGSHNFFQTFSIFFKDYFIKNLQTTIALPFLTHNISAIGGVESDLAPFFRDLSQNEKLSEIKPPLLTYCQIRKVCNKTSLFKEFFGGYLSCLVCNYRRSDF